ncbi:hypothetical protein DEU56DRAFT_799912 [Suillus clintonianus]|uniref:uncharacterized protein n=1 Tax=Suillus clintonianus TaxID=1904413 RepID=UPI001B879E9A|nr:uncharacterized protein DEU56DRAFT_799912 [Suillus clintonianus]KAG2139723.1 hypothetical protein DEU56DRAFT_799912 [Suillus clintonianus]
MSYFDEDSYRLPEGVKRIAYDADTQKYTFRDQSGQLYQNSSGEKYGVLKPVSAPATPRRRVTITERRDPALIRARSVKRLAKTFDDFLPPEYITNAEDSSSAPDSPIQDIARMTRSSTLSKIRRGSEVARPRESSPRGWEDDEKRHLLDDHTSSPASYATCEGDEKELSRSNSTASSFLSLPIIDTHISFE